MSNNQNIVLGITLDHEDGVYRAQRWIKGTVVCSVLSDNTPVGGKPLRLDFVGKESAWTCSLLCGSGDGKNVKERTAFEDARILEEYEAGALLRKGMTSYPFSIFLPKAIAPSLSYTDDSGQGTGCSLAYTLCASLGGDVSTERDVKIVGPTVSDKAYPYCLVPTCISPRAHGPLNESCLAICARVDNTHVQKGEKLVFSLSCRNFTKQDLKRVDVRLEEEIHWTPPSSVALAPTHEHKHVHTLGIIRDVITSSIKVKHDDSHPGTGREDSDHANLSGIKVNSSVRAEMTDDVHAKRNQVELKVPERARDTYDSHDGAKLIKCLHFLKIVMVTKDKPTDPHITIPIKIMDIPLTAQHHHQHTGPKTSVVAVWPEDPLPRSTNVSDHEPTSPSTAASATMPSMIKEVPVE